jgi:hypothetical protein
MLVKIVLEVFERLVQGLITDANVSRNLAGNGTIHEFTRIYTKHDFNS